MAWRGSKIGASSSYWTSISSSASSAACTLSAATSATRSPTKRTLLSRENVSSGPGMGSDCPAVEYTTRGRSSQVSTAATPGCSLALDVSMLLIRACAKGLFKILAINIPRISISAAKAGLPWTSLTASTFRAGVPTIRSDSASGATLMRGITRVASSSPPPRTSMEGLPSFGGPNSSAGAGILPSMGSGVSPRNTAAARRIA